MQLSKVPGSGRGTAFAPTQASTGAAPKRTLPADFDLTGSGDNHMAKMYQGLPEGMRKNIEAHPLVAQHGLTPELVADAMRRDAGRLYKGDFNSAYLNYMQRASGAPVAGGRLLRRPRLPTDPGLPSVPKLDIPTAATNVGGRGVG